MPPAFITLQVPPNVEPGQSIQFQNPTTKQMMQVAVPAGARAGSSFQVQLASSNEATAGELETALKNAQSTAALACTIIKGAAKVTIFTAKVTYAGAKYAHAHGWDKKAASMCASAVSMGGSAMSSMMTSKTGKAAMTMAVGGGAWNAATDYAAGETIANSTPVPGLKQKFPDNPGVAPPPGSSGEQLLYVMVPPDAGPGVQMCVLAPSGQQMLVVVPDGATAGTQFTVVIPGAAPPQLPVPVA